MKSSKLLVATAAIVMTLTGCRSSNTVPPSALPGGGGSDTSVFGNNDAGDSGLVTSRAGNIGGEAMISFPGMLDGDGERLRDLIVYFEFDSSQIRSDFNEMLAAHGRYLASDRNITVRLEGHADERGSREYNIGLGERRAQSVRQILLLQGASAAQISTVSYGEERPAVFGSDDEAYSRNRRVEIIYD